MTTFDETLKAVAAEEDIVALTDESYLISEEKWSDIDRRYSALRNKPNEDREDGLAKAAAFVRKYGPTAFKYLAGSGGGAVAAGVLADDGGYSGVLAKLGQLFGGGL